jgi:hypothetical protein
MADQLQLRRGTTAETLLFTGAQGEVTVDTDKNSLVVHDGTTPGGFSTASLQDVTDSTIYFNDDVAAGSSANAYILTPKSNTATPSNYDDGIRIGFTTNNPNTGPATANFAGLGVKNLKFRGGIDPLAGDISGRVDLVYDAAAGWLEIQRKAEAPPPQIRSVAASLNASAMTVSIIAPMVIDFRAVTPTSGGTNVRRITSNLSLTIPSGATLGTTSGVQSTIVLVAIDVAGTVELAVVNRDGNASFTETGTINTTAISSSSTGISTFYSQTARSGVAYRVMGYVESTQASAGVWATTPTKVQGQGGQNIIEKPVETPLGSGQTWQNLTASRAVGTTYTNNTGRTIAISGHINNSAGGSLSLTVGGVVVCNFTAASGAPVMPFSAVIPAGASYVLSLLAGTATLANWAELR